MKKITIEKYRGGFVLKGLCINKMYFNIFLNKKEWGEIYKILKVLFK